MEKSIAYVIIIMEKSIAYIIIISNIKKDKHL